MESRLLKFIVPILAIIAFMKLYETFNEFSAKEDEECQELKQQVKESCVDLVEVADVQKLKDDIAKTLACYKNPGLAVSVVKNGQKILAEGFGVTSPSKRKKVTSKTLFGLASLTKAFTAALLLDVMAKNGSVKLSSTVREVVGNSFRFNDDLRTEYATIEDLLAHRLRVPGNDAFRFNPEIDRRELLKRVKFFESKFEFRVKGTYSSTNYIMLAAITEMLGRNTWEALMDQKIFRPLQMRSSNFAAAINFDDENVAPPYSTTEAYEGDIDPAFTKQWNNRCGAGCIFSTADDMAHWMNFHLSKGKDDDGHKVFDESTVSNLHSPRSLLPSSELSLVQNPLFPVTQTADLYALGWRVGNYRGYQTLLHTGSTPGYASMLTLVPSENFGVFVAMNGDDANAYYRMSLQNYITDIILGLEPWLDISTICKFPQPWQPRKTSPLPVYEVGLKPFRSWEDYIGVYRNHGFSDIHVEFSAAVDGVIVRFGFGIWQLLPQEKKDKFYGKGLYVTAFYDINFLIFKASSDSDVINCLTVKEFNRSIPPTFHRVMQPASAVV